MGIGSVTAMNSMSNLQMKTAGSTDTKSKNIQNEITDKKQQMQKLSSQEDLSANEKAEEQKKLKREIAGLNTELERHQEEFLRAQEREQMLAQLREEAKPETDEDVSGEKQAQDEASATAAADLPDAQTSRPGSVVFQNKDGKVILKEQMEEAVDQNGKAEPENDAKHRADEITPDEEQAAQSGLTYQDVHAIISANVSTTQENSQEAAISKLSGGIAVLKGEISQDEKYGTDTVKKQEELENLQKREINARKFQLSDTAKLSQEEQQRFYVSFG